MQTDFLQVVAQKWTAKAYPGSETEVFPRELGGHVIRARRAGGEWSERIVPRTFDRLDCARQVSWALDEMLRDPRESEWQVHQDYV